MSENEEKKARTRYLVDTITSSADPPAVLAAILEGVALFARAEVQEARAEFGPIANAVVQAAQVDLVARCVCEHARQSGRMTGEMVANLIRQLVSTRGELIAQLGAAAMTGKGPTLVFGHLPPTEFNITRAFDEFVQLRAIDAKGERAAFATAVAAMCLREPDRAAFTTKPEAMQ